MKYYIIAGEASGDLHGSLLMEEIFKTDKDAIIHFWGGNLMKSTGGVLIKHYKELAFMGIFEVLLNIRTIFKNIEFCKHELLTKKPDVVILIDYPGFNLRIAKFAKLNSFPVCYYISPKVWAWKSSRIKQIKKYIDKLFCIFPFEKDFFAKHNYEIEYIGNPLVDIIEKEKKKITDKKNFLQLYQLDEKPIIAILPGSRKQELLKCLTDVLPLVKEFNSYQFVIAGISSLDKTLYNSIILNYPVKIIFDKTYEILQHSDFAIVKSGTAVLETALFEIPQIAMYKAGSLSFFIGRKLVKLKYVTLPNIIMNEEIVKEILQYDLTNRIRTELKLLINNKNYRSNQLLNYQKLKSKLNTSNAAGKAATIIYNTFKK